MKSVVFFEGVSDMKTTSKGKDEVIIVTFCLTSYTKNLVEGIKKMLSSKNTRRYVIMKKGYIGMSCSLFPMNL